MLCGDHPGPDFGSPYEGVQNARLRLVWIRGPLALSVGNKHIVFHVTGVLIHLLLIFALISFMIYVFIGKRGVEYWLALPSQRFYFRFACDARRARRVKTNG